ncbi:hypothetical protein RND71_004688 [Anisodus tanguticus]|uniref:Uncharacterized protein n=1 Tax=Anisodus tanguticus TaxID=243964 RepID=A0AAE1SQP6_9SOLA|nr:hypothetical protein RND71_004688 [Anisodus tanguticus]
MSGKLYNPEMKKASTPFYFVLLNVLILSGCLQSEARMVLDLEHLSSIKFKGIVRGRSNRQTPIKVNPSPTANTRSHYGYSPPPMIMK